MTLTELFYIAMTSIGAAVIYYAAWGVHVAHKRLDLHNKVIEQMLKSVMQMDETREIVLKNIRRICKTLGIDEDPEDG